MMDRLALNCDAGDTTIDIIGFSRGAALAISFANEVARKLPTLSIRFIGVWDIVGEFGLPGRFVNAGHDLHLPPNAKRVYHAMALDEARSVFQLTRLSGTGRDEDERLVEVWFRGVHSDIGGGNGNFGLNWLSLDWMYAAAIREGLPIAPSALITNRFPFEKTIRVPSGDHVAPPPVTFSDLASEPSEFTTYSVVPLLKRILPPSGDQSGELSVDSYVNRRRPVPLALMTYRPVSLSKTICLPSGDHEGLLSCIGRFVRLTSPEPSAFMR